MTPEKTAAPRLKRSREARHVRLRTHYVAGIELRAFRGIADLKLGIPVEGTTAPWFMLLGENGTGKSSILQAIAITLCGEAHRRWISARPASVLRQGAKAGFVRVHLSGADAPLELEFKRGATRFTYNGTAPTRWRMRIVTSLRKAFPRVQFIVSTHDPLCLRGLDNGEVAVLRRTSRGRIYAVPELPSIKGMRVDQLLTSEYFGLSSSMDPEIEAKFNEMYRLLALRKPTQAQLHRIDTLRSELQPAEVPGTTRRERRLLEIIDSELARTDDEPDHGRRLQIKSKSNERIAADLSKLLATPVVAR